MPGDSLGARSYRLAGARTLDEVGDDRQVFFRIGGSHPAGILVGAPKEGEEANPLAPDYLCVLMPIIESGKTSVVGSFTCTPVVRYELDDAKNDDQVTGKSVVELGTGKTLEIALPPGTRAGQVIRLKGQGKPGREGPAGDALVTVEFVPHPKFRPNLRAAPTLSRGATPVPFYRRLLDGGR